MARSKGVFFHAIAGTMTGTAGLVAEYAWTSRMYLPEPEFGKAFAAIVLGSLISGFVVADNNGEDRIQQKLNKLNSDESSWKDYFEKSSQRLNETTISRAEQQGVTQLYIRSQDTQYIQGMKALLDLTGAICTFLFPIVKQASAGTLSAFLIDCISSAWSTPLEKIAFNAATGALLTNSMYRFSCWVGEDVDPGRNIEEETTRILNKYIG